MIAAGTEGAFHMRLRPRFLRPLRVARLVWMARVLIVGCGCRGRALSAALVAQGHAVRGTTRGPASLAAIVASGAEGVVADPNRLATLTPHLEQVSVLCWLLGSAFAEPDQLAALHGPRLRSLLEALVDTHVRGLVYEAGGSVGSALFEEGARVVERLGATYHMPVAVVHEDPTGVERWRAAMSAAVDGVLGS